MSFCFHLALFLPLIRGSGTVYVVKYELVVISFLDYVYSISDKQVHVKGVIKLYFIPVSYMQHHSIANITGFIPVVKTLSQKISKKT